MKLVSFFHFEELYTKSAGVEPKGTKNIFKNIPTLIIEGDNEMLTE